MCLIMHKLVYQVLCFLFCNKLAFSKSESESNNPIYINQNPVSEKDIEAVFNKVANSFATTKRSVPAYEAQISQSTTLSTTPSTKDFPLLTTSVILYPMIISKATNLPTLRDLPSNPPPLRTLFTPPLPREYANPFADKPTLRGTNVDVHQSQRRPIPPPSLTPAHERIPIKPPDLIEDNTKTLNKQIQLKNKGHDFINKDQFETASHEKDLNNTTDYMSTLHITSISRILLGSNGRKQDIPEILLKQISTKSPSNHMKTFNMESSTISITKPVDHTDYSTYSSIITQQNKKSIVKTNDDDFYESFQGNKESFNINDFNTNNNANFPYSQPPVMSSEIPDVKKNVYNMNSFTISHSLEPAWKLALSLHVYLIAITFTLIALFSVYKIVRFNDSTNLFTQSYFLAIHLLLTFICTLRCFYLFYDAYNLGHSLPESVSNVLTFLPSSLLTVAFSMLILYMFRCTIAQSLYQNKFWSPLIITIAFLIHITLSLSFYIFDRLLGFTSNSKVLSLICQCVYIIVCVLLGLCYMYVYRVIKLQLHISGTKSISNHSTTDIAVSTLKTAITTTIATALLFIFMGFIQLYGIFKIRGHLQPNFWLWWCWEFFVRIIELIICILISWVASLSQYQTREKKIQQHIVHSGFALFPCGNSHSTENVDDALYPAICSTNQAIQNYTIRTGKQVYDDSFPLNTLSEHLNISNTFERHSSRKSERLNHFSDEMRHPFAQRNNDNQSFRKLSNNNSQHKTSSHINEYSSTSGSTMLVAEDGFVRFRNLGSEEDLTSSQNSVIVTIDRRNSFTGHDKFDLQQPIVSTQVVQEDQNSMSHQLHLSHRNQQVYNNT